MKKEKVMPYVFGGIAAVIVFALGLFLFCPAINLQDIGFWILVDLTVLVFVIVSTVAKGAKLFKGSVEVINGNVRFKHVNTKISFKPFIAPIVITALMILIGSFGSAMFNASAYSKILTVSTSDFKTDLSESVGTDSIALMDTASAQMLGDREIGSLSEVVSQFEVSDAYTQIDLNGKPIKVAPLEYAGFLKWINNKDTGINGYVTVDPVSMSASFNKCEGMKYVPSAYLMQDARRYLWTKYPTLLLDNLHFEIDEDGNPFYVASTVKNKIALFNGKTIDGCVTLNPITGETQRYALEDIPNWIDVVIEGDLICEQYNWHGMYQNGFFNSLFTKKGCKQVTTYYDDSEEDSSPVADYGYVSKDGDIWIYTGITSVNGDSSNIGFLLANERTGESRYYEIAGADEKSAMAAAEGEVQEKNYQASFPSLINVEGNPTYIMVLKDSGGLVKLYAAVNVEQYNIVTTASTQSECIAKYKALLGLDETEQEAPDETVETTFTIASIKLIDYNGNTYIYLIDDKNNIFKAKAFENEDMLLLNEGDKVKITHSGSDIVKCEKAE
jgi:hypothetical protein